MSAGVDLRVAAESNVMATILAYISLGVGLGVAPQSVVPAGAPVVGVPLAHTVPFDVVLAWSQSAYRSPAAERALAFAQASAAERDKR